MPDKILGLLKSGVKFKRVNNILRFIETDSYSNSFSFEWEKHKQSLLDSKSGLNVAEDYFFTRTGFTKEEIKGKLILDAGCGMGRFIEIAQKYGGHVIGVDMSNSVEQAYKNVGHLNNVEIAQADIMDLPFKDKSFDFIFSIGVLHHTSNIEMAFKKLTRLVKPGGKMAIWVYSNDGWRMNVYNAIAWCYRIITTKLPQKLLYKLCHIAVPLYYLHCVPYIGRVTRVIFPTSMEAIADWRVLDTFDWYSPRYQTKHTYKEVYKWFVACGFKDIRRLSKRYAREDVSVQGVKI